MHQQNVVKNLITFLTELKHQYVCQFATATRSSQSIVNDILDYSASTEIFGNVAAVGCNGSAVNTCRKDDVIKLLEDNFNKSLQ